jgi:uncharacterized membrane protein
MSLAGVVFLIAGMFAFRREVQAAAGLDKWIALGSVFVAAPLATFGAEHLTAARSLMEAVPEWMPGRLFWAYFVGVCLIAAAVSLTVKKYVPLTTALLAVMFFLFVCMIHLPNLLPHLKERLFWTIPLRDAVFGAGALALAGALRKGADGRGSNWPITFGRLLIAAALGAAAGFVGISLRSNPHRLRSVPAGEQICAQCGGVRRRGDGGAHFDFVRADPSAEFRDWAAGRRTELCGGHFAFRRGLVVSGEGAAEGIVFRKRYVIEVARPRGRF